jgi:hypothetical protein
MQQIYVDSNPTGASVRLSQCGALATKSAVTPAVVWVSRRSTQCELVLAKPNYAEQRMKLKRHVSDKVNAYGTGFDVACDAGVDGEICVAAAVMMLPSFVIDAATGSMFELTPSQAFIDLAENHEPWREGKKP